MSVPRPLKGVAGSLAVVMAVAIVAGTASASGNPSTTVTTPSGTTVATTPSPAITLSVANCYNNDRSTPCNWHAPGVEPPQEGSPTLIMQGGGNTNFSINVSGGNDFAGCFAAPGQAYHCDNYIYIQPGTTGPLVRNVLAGTDLYATQGSGGAEDTTLYFPYP